MAEVDVNNKRSTGSRALVGLAYATLSGWAVVTGYFLIFSQFAPYDDEGYLMITVRNFLSGLPIYDQVYTQYGPVPYLAKWILHVPVGLPVTHDITRFTSLAVWVSTALFSGVAIRRITDSLWTSLLGFGAVFLCLSRITYEPGHPQDLGGLFSSILVLAATYIRPRAPLKFPTAVIGGTLAFLAMTKLNLGVFLFVATGFSWAALTRSNSLRRTGTIAFGATALLLPIVLLGRYFDLGWAGFSVMLWSGMLSLYTVVYLSDAPLMFERQDLGTLLVAGTVAGVLLVLLSILFGTTFGGLLDGLLLQNFRFAGLFYLSAPTHILGPYWSVVSLAACALWVTNTRLGGRFDKLLGLIKLGFGLCTITAVLLTFFVPKYNHVVLSFALPFTWLIAAQKGSEVPFARLLLAIGGLLLSLQIFPIWGSQMAFAAHLPLMCGVIALSDAAEALTPVGRILQDHVKSAFAAAAFLVFFAATIVAFARYSSYNNLGLPGASNVKLSDETSAELNAVVAKAEANCSTLFSMPGMFSFNFWSGLETPTNSNATAWMTLLSTEHQDKIMRSLESAARPCVVYHPRLAHNALRNQKLSDVPLAAYILQHFVETGRFGEYIFLEKRSG